MAARQEPDRAASIKEDGLGDARVDYPFDLASRPTRYRPLRAADTPAGKPLKMPNRV